MGSDNGRRLPMVGQYLTAALPGTGGRIKVHPEDFAVEELPLYEPCGQGEHTYVRIEKRGLSTFAVVRAIGRELHIPARDIGFAGIKDAQAVAQQTLSLTHVEPEELDKLVIPGLKILWVARHRNKLRTGHLKGNRFTIRIRDVGESCLTRAEQILHSLAQHGMPNHYGLQRFGQRANSHLLGRDLLHGDAGAFLSKFLGSAPGTAQVSWSGHEHEARMRFDAGDLGGALQLWPTNMPDERRALDILVRSGNEVDAMESVPRRLCRFLLSAYQSHLFNQIVAVRLAQLHRILEGDLAWKHDSGAVFLVADAECEQPRAERFEISPSGPMFGYKVALAQGEPGRVERGVLEGEGVSLDDFRPARGPRAAGARRPLRVPLKEPTYWFDDGLVLRFELPAGSYATNVIREVMKQDV